MAGVFWSQPVDTIMLDSDQKACGVVLEDGTEIRSKMVLSNATARITYLNLTPQEALPKEFIQDVQAIDYTSPVTKINGRSPCSIWFLSLPCLYMELSTAAKQKTANQHETSQTEITWLSSFFSFGSSNSIEIKYQDQDPQHRCIMTFKFLLIVP